MKNEALDLFAMFPLDVEAKARAVREYVLRVLGDVTEEADATAKVVGYGITPGYKGLVCTILLSRDGVKIGIVGGAKLPDPLKLMEGTGKVHRYVPIATLADLQKPALRTLLETALQTRRSMLT